MSFLADAAAGAAAAVSSAPPPAAPVATVKTTKKIDKISKKGERRLVEYFIVVSSLPRDKGKEAEQQYGDSDNMSPFQPSSGRRFGSYDHDEEWEELTGEYDFQPVITSRYPFDDHEGNPLHESVTSFCHPTGSIRLRMESALPKVHYFVTTGGRGQHVYGTVLTVFEPFMITLKPSQKGDSDELEAGGEWKSGGEPEAKNATAKKMELFLPKCLCILSQYPYLVAFREYLTQLHRLSKMGDMPLPVERYITNFCAEIPAPPPGSFEVQTTILDSVIKFWSPPHNQPIAWVSLPFSHLFECLDLDNVLLVWHCLTLERQVLFTSTQLSLLTTCSEVVLSLLFPMRWSHAYIPVLPHFLIPILSAPMPYLCGIDKANLPEALLDLSRECVVVDLDSNQVTLGPMTPPLPPMPHSHAQSLRSRLEANAGMVFREARSLTKNDDFSERGTHLAPHVKMMADAMWESRLVLFDEAFHLAFTPEMEKRNLLNGNDNSGIDTSENDPYNPTVPIRIMTAAEKMNMRKQSQWDAVQESFLDTYVFLLRNYRKFLIFPSKHNEGAYGGAGFREKEFVESQRYDMQAFLRELNGTQMFNDFVTKRLYGSGEADVLFFDMAVDNFLKNAGLMTNVSVGDTIKKRLSNGVGTSPAVEGGARKDTASNSAEAKKKGKAPLIQSARVHRKLKTIVPPEPSSADLPPPPPQPTGGPSTTLSGVLSAADPPTDADDQSVGSVSTTGTNSTGLGSTTRSGISSLTTPRSPKSTKGPSSYRRRQEQLAEALEKEEKHCYVYHTFPSELNHDLFGTPRPLNSAVLAEFAKQREDAARFRRNNSTEDEQAKAKKTGMDSTDSKAAPQTAEMATFTVFFMAFTAAVGKELIEISRNPLTGGDRTIWSTYTHPTREMSDTDDETDVSSLAARAAGVDLSELEDEISLNVEDGAGGDEDDTESKEVDDGREQQDEPEGAVINGNSHVEGSPNSVGKDGSPVQIDSLAEKEEVVSNGVGRAELTRENTPQVTNKTNAADTEDVDTPRKRFQENLSTAQIEEAKATARAQLGLAFEMLNMMRKRGLKADPVDYQSLIDACGRCGDAEKAAKLLTQMHEDGIAADGVVYACLVSAFSSDNSLRKVSGKSNEEDLPEWANSASVEVDWNKFQRRTYLEIAKERFLGKPESEEQQNAPNVAPDDADTAGGRVTKLGMQSLRAMRNFVSGRRVRPADDASRTANGPELDSSGVENRKDFFVTDTVLRQILLGENLLEIVYPDISVDTDNELCPRCNTLLTDEDVVAGWTPGDSQDYTTKCPICPQKFVPHFCVQSTSESFVGSRGPGTPLLCERLSPWVLQKEVRSVMSDREGIEDLLSPEWREKETKNATLWWNLVLSFMRFKFPFSFLLQGSFDTTLIAPSPDDEVA